MKDAAPSNSPGKFHEGESAVQRAAGEQETALQNSVMIADAVMANARPFLLAQRMLVVASRDRDGNLWAPIIFGQPGFVSANDDGQSVTIDRTMTFGNDADILWTDLQLDAPLGILAIELSMRRRLRVNGRVSSLTKERLVLRVEQTYPNCPKYIQRRVLRISPSREAKEMLSVSEGHKPDAALLAAVRQSDTLFVASGHPTRGLDASHRGGSPGFIGIPSPGVLRIPDYAGNSLFNTLGNLAVDPHCGLTLLDFNAGRLYQMTGKAVLHLEFQTIGSDAIDSGRFWDFMVEHWRSTQLPVHTDWEFLDYSPYNP